MFEATTRRGFLSEVGKIAGAGIGVIAGTPGLAALVNGCTNDEPISWNDAELRYAQAIQSRQRVHVGNWKDYHRWISEETPFENPADPVSRIPIFRLWVLAEQGEYPQDTPQETYQEIVIPGVNRFIDFMYRKTMEQKEGTKRYDLAQLLGAELNGLFWKLDDQIRTGALRLFPASAVERDAVTYHAPERMRLNDYTGLLQLQGWGNRRPVEDLDPKTEDFHPNYPSISADQYRDLMRELTADSRLPLLRTTYGL